MNHDTIRFGGTGSYHLSWFGLCRFLFLCALCVGVRDTQMAYLYSGEIRCWIRRVHFAMHTIYARVWRRTMKGPCNEGSERFLLRGVFRPLPDFLIGRLSVS